MNRLVHALAIVLLALLLLAGNTAHASGLSIGEVETRLAEQVYVMDARVDIDFSERALEALASGVPLTLRMDIEVRRTRNWLPDETIATLEQYYQLTYHALSNSYLVRNLNSGALYVHPSQESAIEALGIIRGFPLLDAKLIIPGERYEIEMRTKLDIDSLPSPLKLLAYVFPDWHLSSAWSTWSLQP
ncbi:MAG TPA: DUF4390 domain-containing protein [Gammaproteobacteria bacterium]